MIQPLPAYAAGCTGQMPGFIPVMPVCPQLANAYVPYQYIRCVLEPQEALNKGTLFPELYDPYKEKRTLELQKDGGDLNV